MMIDCVKSVAAVSPCFDVTSARRPEIHPGARSRVASGRTALGRGFRRRGEPDGEAGASVRAVIHGQASSLLAEDLGCKIEAVAAAGLLGGEEGLEDPLEIVVGDAGTVVGDLDLDPLAIEVPVGEGPQR